jgi:hypothetical protein
MQGTKTEMKKVCAFDMYNSMLDGSIDLRHYDSCRVVQTIA